MVTAIIIAGSILVLVILAMIIRVQSLISLTKTDEQAIGESSDNKINAAMFLVFLIVGTILAVWTSVSASEYFLPEASSAHGKRTDNLFWITMGVIGCVCFATHVLLFYFPYKYQYREDRKATFYPHNDRLELVWTVIPGIVLTVLVVSGWWVWRDITSEAPANATVVEIVGKQFNWLVRYPGDKQAVIGKSKPELGRYDYRLIDAVNEVGIDFTDESSFDDFMSGEIHVPKGVPVLLKIHARDVLHSVFMPHFRLKMDAVPGMQTQFWFVPDKSTAEMREQLENPKFNYELACTEVCGRGHFSMKMTIIVDEPEEYQQWVASKKPFLAQNRAYMAQVPANLKEKALKVIGPDENVQATDSTAASAPSTASLPVSTGVIANK